MLSGETQLCHGKVDFVSAECPLPQGSSFIDKRKRRQKLVPLSEIEIHYIITICLWLGSLKGSMDHWHIKTILWLLREKEAGISLGELRIARLVARMWGKWWKFENYLKIFETSKVDKWNIFCIKLARRFLSEFSRFLEVSMLQERHSFVSFWMLIWFFRIVSNFLSWQVFSSFEKSW